ncbi:conserved hypothetical protein [Candidatus Desulfosporosinus infrequens]|uniref:Flagellar hook-length control protein-like C-terminal domain-containing protein n=1 Tax=Candidatus Desulfosporosinus infrequens TaxID=2043169 RepID=A0A2U3LXU1_9FIRM|nr:conserved hypothetical protein [Candidatus Desulfosporosinus infrequens]
MEVGGILTPGGINRIDHNQLRVGERLLVEVIQKTGESEGTIRVKGQDLFALLETSTKLGEQFWVKVGDTKEGSLLLIREPLLDKQEDIQGIPQQVQQLTERGLPINQDMITLLTTFSAANSDSFGTLLENIQGTMTDEFLVNLRKAIPSLDELSEGNGAEKLVECLKKLGLNYEQRLQQMLKLGSPAKEVEKNNLRETFKFKLLEGIQNQEGQDLHDPDGPLAHLLQKITGQQLWFKTGALDNAFMLLHLPLFNQGQLVPVQIAIESARKGSKMDEQHCRVAIQIETQQLGDIGIDAYFNQDLLTFRVLTRNLPFLPQLLEAVMPETKEGFAKLGFNLAKVETGDLDQSLEFQNFLRGIRRSGVDVQR